MKKGYMVPCKIYFAVVVFFTCDWNGLCEGISFNLVKSDKMVRGHFLNTYHTGTSRTLVVYLLYNCISSCRVPVVCWSDILWTKIVMSKYHNTRRYSIITNYQIYKEGKLRVFPNANSRDKKK